MFYFFVYRFFSISCHFVRFSICAQLFLFLWIYFSTSFLRNSGRSENLGTATCSETVFGVSKGILHVNYFHSNKAFFVSVECHGDHMTVTKLRCIWPTSLLGILPDVKQWCLCTDLLICLCVCVGLYVYLAIDEDNVIIVV